MIKKLFLILIAAFLFTKAESQDVSKSWQDFGIVKFGTVASTNDKGIVTVNCDSRLQTILSNFSSAFSQKTDRVYRLLLFFGSGTAGKNQAQGIKASFETEFPSIPTYLVFEEPYFKVKVGDFRTKIEAEGFKMKIQKDFSKAFIIEE